MNSPLTENARSEKALWYQEVLSLDPASRIFLPYARLLAETGRRMEAVEVLRAGLTRHPEFLDARLLLIDLLHDCGQDAAAGLEAAGIIESLSRCSALWEIWSRLPGVRADQSAMLLFFGATFRQGGPGLADVFEAGMKALHDKSGPERGSDLSPDEDSPSPSAASAGNFRRGQDSPVPPALQEDAPAAPCGTPAPLPSDAACIAARTDVPSASGNDAATEVATPCACDSSSGDASAPAEPSRAFVMDENAPWYSLDAVPDDDDVYDDEPAPAAPVIPPSAMQLLFPENDAPAEDGDASVSPVPRASAEGKSSLCTRSMARILEEQGATGEAADIYRELLEVSSSAEERAELNAKLDSLMQGAQNPAPEQPADSGLLNMLETLAVRLENKSRA